MKLESINLRASGRKLTALNIAKKYKKAAYAESEFMAINYGDQSGKEIGGDVISLGDIDSASLPLIKFAKYLYANNPSSVIMTHNHPAGSPDPSNKDLATTKMIKNLCELLDIKLLDHVIIGGESWYSIKEEKFYKYKNNVKSQKSNDINSGFRFTSSEIDVRGKKKIESKFDIIDDAAKVKLKYENEFLVYFLTESSHISAIEKMNILPSELNENTHKDFVKYFLSKSAYGIFIISRMPKKTSIKQWNRHQAIMNFFHLACDKIGALFFDSIIFSGNEWVSIKDGSMSKIGERPKEDKNKDKEVT